MVKFGRQVVYFRPFSFYLFGHPVLAVSVRPLKSFLKVGRRVQKFMKWTLGRDVVSLKKININKPMYHKTVPTPITVMLKHMTGWQKLPLQTMRRSYNKYNANMTRNVAYYMTTGLCLVRATCKKTQKKQKKKKLDA